MPPFLFWHHTQSGSRSVAPDTAIRQEGQVDHLHASENDGTSSLRRVIFRPRAALELGPFIPLQQTCGDHIGLSVPCQHRKWSTLLEHLVDGDE
jgi:hypothetical protein